MRKTNLWRCFNILGIILDFIVSNLGKIYGKLNKCKHKLRLFLFNKNLICNSQIKDKEAKNIAYSILSSKILKAVPYKNINLNEFIAVFTQVNKSNNGYDHKICILRKLGENYTSVWQKKSSFLIESLNVEDIDNDGEEEIVFIEHGSGTGSWIRKLNIYSMKKDKLYKVEEYQDYNSLSSSYSPTVKTNFKLNTQIGKAIEKTAKKYGFLKKRIVDLEDKKFAHYKWHEMNGKKRNGFVNLKYYNGKPKYENELHKKLEIDDLIWYSYVMEPLYGYIKSEDKHFVAYAPSFIQNFVDCFVSKNRERLFFTCCNDEGIYDFEFDNSNKEIGEIKYYTHYNNKKIPKVKSLESIANNKLLINKDMVISIGDLNKT